MNVSAVVRVSLFDVPYLGVTLPHVLRQARYAFDERIVIVDPDARRGQGRRHERAELDRILSDAGPLIDRVLDVPMDESTRRAVHDRYFGPSSPVALGADRAIYPTLFGLEAVAHDACAWIDADVLFHATGKGWVAAGLAALARDEAIWFAATRGGPRRRWLPTFGPDHAAVLSAGHFVCDRRRIHGKLRWVGQGTSVFAAALERHAAGTHIVDAGWHVRTHSHAPPFADWIDKLADAVERGDVPASQRDGWLRLDHIACRSEWRRLLFPADEGAHDRPGPRPVARLIERRPVPGTLPISVILPIRNRAGVDVKNALASLAWQRGGRPWETIVVSHGSDPVVDAELADLVVQAGATLITVGLPEDPWSKPLALNTGIRATDPAVPFVMTMDADMILAEDFLETVLSELSVDPQRIVLCQSSDLREDCVLPADTDELRAQLGRLKAEATLRGRHGTGGIQAVPRSFLMEVRGYDEDMRWWGALDTDLVHRAEAMGLRASWVTDRTAMLHQWHPRKHRILDDTTTAREARDSWLQNHELMRERTGRPVRNQRGWGAEFVDRSWERRRSSRITRESER